MPDNQHNPQYLLMESITISLFLISVCLYLPAKSQYCIGTQCLAWTEIVESCNSTSEGNAVKFESCLCRNTTQYQADVETCYECIQTGGNQSFINDLGELLNICATTATSATTPTAAQTITILGTVTPTTTSASGTTSTCPHGSKLWGGYGLLFFVVVWVLMELW